ncbi:tRNA U34 5-methylaminomethyl-2-thiouridine-forming methyltransferase MnmC [Mariniphaga anaerophila]|uniref:tRNA U34 5-methylaminomethyl-2-thiouridine-forming methyltransferase MnmC n=1 Tax=Mariniphaga anaerophila TaxID=1484053 RepID=A0A1M4VXM7_9BACT|nr:tRNA (5-methylaminomethyl-2-thiouridine)(34)-methyltransferase MnmD [Mariniphaga anaerophila]SHE73718.1 tRNA U34 5-methylaminomethyl-2-thiouridine-forming methyltransferase MnmC [Mariniphaga anaerophila]
MNPILKNTGDGSATLFVPEMNEQYHSMNGAITESNHVYLGNGFNYHASANPVVFEVGFGTGLNCLLTAVQAQKQNRPTFYISIEKFPLEQELINQLNYGELVGENGSTLFEKIHSCTWNIPTEIIPGFKLLKLRADFNTENWALPEKCDVIYFDAFGPDKQPEMWSQENLQRLYNFSSDNGVFVTYSAKGEVRRRLKTAGYNVERLPGPPGKMEMLRGIKVLSKI